MSFSGGVFSINTAGQPVVDGTVISASVFNALTADLATGLSTCVLKDGTQTTTAVVPFAAGLSTPDASFTIYDDGDNTKIAKFQCSSITAGATRTYTLFDASDTLVGLTATQTLTNKTLTTPTVTNPTVTTGTFTSPTLVTPVLGTPSSGTLSSCTGLPIGAGTTGTLAADRGGTGATSLTANNVILGNGTSAVQFVAPGTAGNVLTSDGSTFASTAKVTVMTSSSASGTSIDFTSIPATAKIIQVLFQDVSTNGTAYPRVQIGAGSVTTSGYGGTASNGTTTVAFSNGFDISVNTGAADTRSGIITLTLLGSNIWVMSGIVSLTSAGSVPTISSGSITLGGTLDRVRITTSNGTDAYDAGNVTVVYQ